MSEVERSVRYRINVSTSVKGHKTYDCTVDATENIDRDEGFMESVLERSDALVAALDAKYPAPEA